MVNYLNEQVVLLKQEALNSQDEDNFLCDLTGWCRKVEDNSENNFLNEINNEVDNTNTNLSCSNFQILYLIEVCKWELSKKPWDNYSIQETITYSWQTLNLRTIYFWTNNDDQQAYSDFECKNKVNYPI